MAQNNKYKLEFSYPPLQPKFTIPYIMVYKKRRKWYYNCFLSLMEKYG